MQLIHLNMLFQRSDVVFVDIQNVQGNNGQVFAKELAYMFANSIIPIQFLFKPPYAFEELNEIAINQDKFLYQNITRLQWIDGNIEYTQLPNILNNIREFIIVVKGEQKKKFLEKFLRNSNIINLDVGCGLNSLRNYSHNCQIHEPAFHRCAILNVFKLLIFMEKNSMLTE